MFTKATRWQRKVAECAHNVDMEEPHQRVQSGKLRSIPIKSFASPVTKINKEQKIVYLSIDNACDLEIPDIDESYDAYMQTPMSLNDLQVELLRRVANGYGINDVNAIDRDWRRTWNIGTWCIGNDVSLSINIMQPNIANCWIGINIDSDTLLLPVVNKFNKLDIPKSTCRIIRTKTGYQLQGRLSILVANDLISENIVTRNDIKFDTLNITQSRIFCWMIVGKESKYYCTLTKDSVDILMKYIPSWCADINEATAANNTTLRIKNPIHDNDSSQLSITVCGWLQYTGKYENLSRLHEALSIAFRNVIKSIHLKTFLQSMEFQVVPNNF